jgi:hypothetical protein
LPKPRNALLPIILVLLVLLFVLGIVLSANNGRNLTALLKALDLPLPQFLTFVVTAPAAPDVMPASTAFWPWLKGVSHHAAPMAPVSMPDEMCGSLSSDGQETPSFVKSGADGWECSLLSATSNDPASSSLFLQVRGGDDGQFTIVRVKFNLADGRLTDDFSRRSLAFLHRAMTLPPSESLDEELMEKLASQADFYFIAGYTALSFRREVDDPDRYNLIGFNRKIVGADRLTAWPKAISAAAVASSRAPKGPRISAQSTGSP